MKSLTTFIAESLESEIQTETTKVSENSNTDNKKENIQESENAEVKETEKE